MAARHLTRRRDTRKHLPPRAAGRAAARHPAGSTAPARTSGARTSAATRRGPCRSPRRTTAVEGDGGRCASGFEVRLGRGATTGGTTPRSRDDLPSGAGREGDVPNALSMHEVTTRAHRPGDRTPVRNLPEREGTMITRMELDRLMERPASDVPVLSLYLDLRPGPAARRAREVFLARQRAALDAPARGGPGGRRAALEEALEGAERWIAGADPSDAGAAVFAAAGGDAFDAFTLPVPVANQLVVAARPAVAPLLHVLQGHRRHAVALVDRDHLRMLGVWMERVADEEAVRMDPYPAAHDVQGGGFAEQRYQRRKLEEARHFLAEFAQALAAFVARTGADDVVLAGTDENVGRFRRVLSPELDARVIATASVPVDAPAAEVVDRLQPVLGAIGDPDAEELLSRLRERAATGYQAATGVQPTLAALQSGKVRALLLVDDPALRGGRCARCGFLFADGSQTCPYDGAPVGSGVPVVEEALRIAHAQGAFARLVPHAQAREFAGAGALLRF